jgi:hypothetical protein
MTEITNHSSSFDLDQELGETYYKSKEIEGQLAEKTIEVIKEFITRRYEDGRRPALRDAHAESTGCVTAIFCVDNAADGADVLFGRGLHKSDLFQGVFKPGKKYEAWIRFSNGNSERQNGRWPDPRGMAIKLLDVEGERLLLDEKHTQDFILVNRPVFFGDDLERYNDALRQYLSGGTIAQYLSLFQLSFREMMVALRVNLNLITNPLFQQYWSMTSYRLGPKTGTKTAVKYTAKPTTKNPATPFSRTLTFLSPNFSLKNEVDKVLRVESVTFDFCVQPYVDLGRTPIEDCKKEWCERDSPPIRVARIIIPAQDVMCAKREAFCENLSFNPWHGLRIHKPLGAVNRVRRNVYLEISKYRHQLNSIEPFEPQSEEGDGDPRAS